MDLWRRKEKNVGKFWFSNLEHDSGLVWLFKCSQRKKYGRYSGTVRHESNKTETKPTAHLGGEIGTILYHSYLSYPLS